MGRSRAPQSSFVSVIPKQLAQLMLDELTAFPYPA